MYKLRTLLGLGLFILIQHAAQAGFKKINEPDSVYLFSYANGKNNDQNGLHFAWSANQSDWFSIGNEYSFLKSDYGRWGTEKRMLTPFLFQGPNGTWQCVWSVNERDNTFAIASSTDLLNWKPQNYPKLKEGVNCLRPTLTYNAANKTYLLSYTATGDKYYSVASSDLKTYSPVNELPAGYTDPSVTLNLRGAKVMGQVHYVAWSLVDQLIKAYENKQYQNLLNNEEAAQDGQRFAGLKNVEANFKIRPEKTKSISDLLVGIFFEDINYAADGGLYAELIQNRDFEYTPGDKEFRDNTWNSMHSWTLKGDHTNFSIDSISPIHPNNLHYAVLNVKQPEATLLNAGFDGIPVQKGETYDFSMFTKLMEGKKNRLQISLLDKERKVLAQTIVSLSGTGWKNIRTSLLASADAKDAVLELKPLDMGKLALDMVSLFPRKTFKGRKNGLRADLAQTIADIHPRFVRFPGGCVAHGDGIDNIYRWKNTIGPLQNRKPQRNLWGYHQSAGLGYFEYFQFCEDIGAAPLPVLAAGVPCQNSATGGAGQQGGIPMDQMDAYIQDIFDLIEWANGDATTTWGKKRAESGHPKPFNLKYIGIGNEDLISDVFEERFTMIFNALKKKHPEITVIGTVGPAAEGADYSQGWDIATKLKVPMVDEHYYQSTGWFINHQDFYDSYDRSKSKVYLGEYAAFLPGRPNNMETALAEAVYLTALERNGDVVSMASYAPLLAKEGRTQWNPNLIYFSNNEVKPTQGYEIQKLYGQNSGNKYVPADIEVSTTQDAVKKRIAFSVVSDAKNKDLIIKLVNVLPVAVNSKIDLNGIVIANAEAVKTVIQGNPADKHNKPVVSACVVADKFNMELPAYSFTIIRIKTK